MSIIRELEIVDLVKDSELARNMEGKRHFEFKLNDKAAKSKLIKGAKRKHFDLFIYLFNNLQDSLECTQSS